MSARNTVVIEKTLTNFIKSKITHLTWFNTRFCDALVTKQGEREPYILQIIKSQHCWSLDPN